MLKPQSLFKHLIWKTSNFLIRDIPIKMAPPAFDKALSVPIESRTLDWCMCTKEQLLHVHISGLTRPMIQNHTLCCQQVDWSVLVCRQMLSW